jgi:hypothetical protein
MPVQSQLTGWTLQALCLRPWDHGLRFNLGVVLQDQATQALGGSGNQTAGHATSRGEDKAKAALQHARAALRSVPAFLHRPHTAHYLSWVWMADRAGGSQHLQVSARDRAVPAGIV